MSNDPYTDDEYDSTYKDVHGEEPTRDQYTDEATDDTFFPSGVGGSMSPSGWGIWPGGDTVDAEYDGTEGDHPARRDATASDEDGSWWDEGLIAGLLVVGVALFLFPEPATSAVGITLLAVGVVAWLVDWAM